MEEHISIQIHTEDRYGLSLVINDANFFVIAQRQDQTAVVSHLSSPVRDYFALLYIYVCVRPSSKNSSFFIAIQCNSRESESVSGAKKFD